MYVTKLMIMNKKKTYMTHVGFQTFDNLEHNFYRQALCKTKLYRLNSVSVIFDLRLIVVVIKHMYLIKKEVNYIGLMYKYTNTYIILRYTFTRTRVYAENVNPNQLGWGRRVFQVIVMLEVAGGRRQIASGSLFNPSQTAK